MNNIEKLDAQTLTDHLRQRVLEECRNNMKVSVPLMVCYIVVAGASLMLLFGSMLVMPPSEFPDKYPKFLMWILPLFVVAVIMTYVVFIKPRNQFKRAEKGDYKYYIGAVSDRWTEVDEESDAADHFLLIGRGIKCKCKEETYLNAKIGDICLVVYFNEKRPALCILIEDSDEIWTVEK